MVVIEQKWLFSGKSSFIRPSGCIREKVIVFGQSGCIRAKLVVFGQKKFYSGKNCCIPVKEVVSGQMVVFEKKPISTILSNTTTYSRIQQICPNKTTFGCIRAK